MIKDLDGLKLALDTNDMSFFHGNMEEIVKEMVNYLTEVHETLDDLGFENIEDLKSTLEKLDAFDTYRTKMDDFLNQITEGKLNSSYDATYEDMLVCSL